MARNVRFPQPTNVPQQKAEPDLRIQILAAATPLVAGGGLLGGGLNPWKKAFPSSIYAQFVIEFMGSAQMTVNDGTVNSGIGLFGEINNSSGVPERFLIGVLGYNLGAVMPQIRIHSASNGFAQVVNIATVYDTIYVGGIFADVTPPAAGTVTVTARPVIERDYAG